MNKICESHLPRCLLVYRRIGGLEILGRMPWQVYHVYRRIGGLENPLE